MNYKKIISMVLIIALVMFAFIACSTNDKKGPTDNNNKPGGTTGTPNGNTKPGGNGQTNNGNTTNGGTTGTGGTNGNGGTAGGGVPAIPHATDGAYADCKSCHKEVEQTHASFGDISDCSKCHKPA